MIVWKRLGDEERKRYLSEHARFVLYMVRCREKLLFEHGKLLRQTTISAISMVGFTPYLFEDLHWRYEAMYADRQ